MTALHHRGVLIIHGLTATPATMSPTIEALEEAGYAISAPLLPGHGTTVEDLAQTTWQDWAGAVRAAFDALAAKYDTIYYIGLSMGALLGLHLAATIPAASRWSLVASGDHTGSIVTSKQQPATALKAMALLATPLHLSSFVRRIVPVVRYSPIRWIYTASLKDWKTSVADPDGLRAYQESSYDRIPTKAVYQIYDLEHVLTPELRKIHLPTLLVHSHHDEVAPPSNVHDLCAAITNPAPDVLWLDNSYHVLTLDYERDEMNRAILQFFEKHHI